ncbi:MAG: SAM-dependent chlorinase/fluorinase [Actinomycetota bacterium]
MASRPIVFLSDYGLEDEFVGICHGVISGISPESRVIDLTHSVPPQNVLRGATTLAESTGYMPPNAVYLAVVDPGVGSTRRAVVVETSSGATLVGPDNGLLSIAWERLQGAVKAAEIKSDRVILQPVSKTFHGRDIFAPAAAHLSAGFDSSQVGPEVDVSTLRRLQMRVPRVDDGSIVAEVTGVDRFGNVQLNVRQEHISAAAMRDSIEVGGRRIPLVESFSMVAPDELAVVIDSHGWISLVVNRGHAASLLGLGEGSEVVISRAG